MIISDHFKTKNVSITMLKNLGATYNTFILRLMYSKYIINKLNIIFLLTFSYNRERGCFVRLITPHTLKDPCEKVIILKL